MLKKDVQVGKVYLTNQRRRVKILAERVSDWSGRRLTHWTALNLGTGREITIKSAAKLLREVL